MKNMLRMDVERQSISDCTRGGRARNDKLVLDQSAAGREIVRDCLVGPFDTEQQAKDDAISTLTGSSSVH